MRSIIALCLLWGMSDVTGYGTFRTELPNGGQVSHPCKPNFIWKGVGHLNAEGGGRRNQFGIDFNNSSRKWSRDLCMKDSDGDGLTNGQELGDPDCVWVKDGDHPSRTTDITHPGVCTPFNASQCQGKNDWVDCSSEEFVCPSINQPDIYNITLRFPRTAVPAQETTYKCMVFDIPTDRDYHMVAYKPEIDNDNVMHHIILYGCTDNQATIPTEPYDCNMGAGYNCQQMIGAWALGIPGVCFNANFGMLFGRSGYKRIAMEFHWNNPKLESSWFDSSGLTLYYTSNLRPNNGAILTLGQLHLEIPPGQESVTFNSTCTSACTTAALEAPIYVTRAINHMHYLGSAQSVEQRRNGQRVTFITNEPDYNYDDPKFMDFDPPQVILPGDELVTTCRYRSTYSKKWVYYGDGTSDEMCFAFLAFYPAEAVPEPYCNSWKSIDVCALRKKPVLVNGCNAFDFVYAGDTTAARHMVAVTESCHLSGPCTDECKFAILDAKTHPCLRGGDIKDYVVNLMQRSKAGLQFLRRLDMCNIKRDDVVYPSSGSRSHITGMLLIVVVVYSYM